MILYVNMSTPHQNHLGTKCYLLDNSAVTNLISYVHSYILIVKSVIFL